MSDKEYNSLKKWFNQDFPIDLIGHHKFENNEISLELYIESSHIERIDHKKILQSVSKRIRKFNKELKHKLVFDKKWTLNFKVISYPESESLNQYLVNLDLKYKNDKIKYKAV